VAATFVATASAGVEVGEKNNGLSICDEQYLKIWDKVAREKAGPYSGYAGRNLVEDGVTTKNGSRPVTEAECEDGLAVMDRMLHPAPAPVEYTATTTTEAAPAATGTPPEYIADCESGGSYSALNESSGAYGKWQIIPSTAAAYGCDLSTPAGQDACAAEIYADVGTSAWVCG